MCPAAERHVECDVYEEDFQIRRQRCQWAFDVSMCLNLSYDYLEVVKKRCKNQ